MSIRERRTTFYEWSCDGPGCENVERIFSRGLRPEGWITAQVTERTAKAFCSDRCSVNYWNELLDHALLRGGC